jgi:hypothetical protein
MKARKLMVSIAARQGREHQKPSVSRPLHFFNLPSSRIQAEKSFALFRAPLILLFLAPSEVDMIRAASQAVRPQTMNSPFMARAIELAVENVRSGRGGPFGAVIVKDGNIIAEGVNQVTLTNDPTAHAEVLAIREAKRSSTFVPTHAEFLQLCQNHRQQFRQWNYDLPDLCNLRDSAEAILMNLGELQPEQNEDDWF